QLLLPLHVAMRGSAKFGCSTAAVHTTPASLLFSEEPSPADPSYKKKLPQPKNPHDCGRSTLLIASIVMVRDALIFGRLAWFIEATIATAPQVRGGRIAARRTL